MSTTLVASIEASLSRFCYDFAATNGFTTTLYNFDAFAVTNELPDGDLIGTHQLTYDLNGPLVTVSGMIGVATTLDDANLVRLGQICGLLLEKCVPNAEIPLYAADTGTKIGIMKVMDGTSLSPSMQAKLRPLKLLSIRLSSDHAYLS